MYDEIGKDFLDKVKKDNVYYKECSFYNYIDNGKNKIFLDLLLKCNYIEGKDYTISYYQRINDNVPQYGINDFFIIFNPNKNIKFENIEEDILYIPSLRLKKKLSNGKNKNFNFEIKRSKINKIQINCMLREVDIDDKSQLILEDIKLLEKIEILESEVYLPNIKIKSCDNLKFIEKIKERIYPISFKNNDNDKEAYYDNKDDINNYYTISNRLINLTLDHSNNIILKNLYVDKFEVLNSNIKNKFILDIDNDYKRVLPNEIIIKNCKIDDMAIRHFFGLVKQRELKKIDINNCNLESEMISILKSEIKSLNINKTNLKKISIYESKIGVIDLQYNNIEEYKSDYYSFPYKFYIKNNKINEKNIKNIIDNLFMILKRRNRNNFYISIDINLIKNKREIEDLVIFEKDFVFLKPINNDIYRLQKNNKEVDNLIEKYDLREKIKSANNGDILKNKIKFKL